MKKLSVAAMLVCVIMTAASCQGNDSGTTGTTPAASAVTETMAVTATASEEAPGTGTEVSVSKPAEIEPNAIELEGTIGGLPVHMHMLIKDGAVTGAYSYDTLKQDLRLEGTIEANRMLSMKEFDENGAVTGTFNCWLVPGIRLTGSWTNAATYELSEVELEIINGIPDDAVWSGERFRQGAGRFESATLVIFHETDAAFDFQLDAFSGSHMGFLEGTAVLTGTTATYTDTINGAVLTLTINDDVITVTANNAANMQAGMGVVFDGEFSEVIPTADTLLSQRYVLNQEQEDAFRAMTGADYELFLDTAHLCYDGEDLDGFGAKVYTWMVRGLSGVNESIVMFMPDGSFCAGVIDIENHVIKVYTNAAEVTDIPETIRQWAADYPELTPEFINSSAA